MTPHVLLSARFDALDLRLQHAAEAITSIELDKKLRSRMQDGLQARLRDCRDRLGLKRGDVAAAPITGDSWSSLSRLEADCADLLHESLAFLQGGRARAAGIDNGLCETADQLLDEIEQRCELGWNRFTILAESETFNDTVQLIRLRYPPGGIWDLPIAVHEYGHFALFRITVPDPDGRSRTLRIAEYLRHRAQQSRQSAIAYAHLQELFSDCFATFVLGPSYPLTCLFLRLDPAGDDTQTHPAPAKRLAAMKVVLAVMNEKTGSEGDFAATLTTLDQFWSVAIDRNGYDRAATLAATETVREDAEMFAHFLLQSIGAARYVGWGNARIVSDALRGDRQAKPEPSVRDVLTAAWMNRVHTKASPDAISRDALTYCRGLKQ